MITAVHTLIYADDAEAARAFLRDVLGWPHVDAHGGWLIFQTGPSELGVHPTRGEHSGETWSTTPHHQISLMCDDIHQTVADLTAKGAEFTRDVKDEGFGLTTMLKIPGAGEMMLYQPKHPLAYQL
jgi:catechol 2,3-dioxygenase-like lactoylglutathione lyase family enzyme